MTAARTLTAALAAAGVLLTGCATSEPPTSTRPTEHPNRAAYLIDVRAHTSLDWRADRLLVMGRQLCRIGLDESAFFDSIGVLAADRAPVERAARQHLC